MNDWCFCNVDEAESSFPRLGLWRWQDIHFIKGDADVPPWLCVFWIVVEFDVAWLQCKEGVVSPHTYIFTWMKSSTSLAYNYIAWNDKLSTIFFGTETFAWRVAIILS